MTALYRFFLSLRTVFWLFAAALGCLLAGSLMIPANLAFYSGIDDTPLFHWLAVNRDIFLTWWIWGIVVVLGILAASTIACTAEYFSRRLSLKTFLLKVSPQIMHIGVLFVMLGHLLTASGGFKRDHTVREGDHFDVEESLSLEFERATIMSDEMGFPSNWSGRLWWRQTGKRLSPITIGPAKPAFHKGYGVWFSSVNVEEDGSVTAVFRTSRDPGAPWALFGAVLLCLGGAIFLFNLPGNPTRLPIVSKW